MMKLARLLVLSNTATDDCSYYSVSVVQHKAIVDSWFHPQYHILMNSTKLCSCLTLTWWTSSKHNVVLDFGPLAPWYENMTSSIKPEVYNISLPSEEDQTTATCNMQKIWRSLAMWFSSCEQTDGQYHHSILHPSQGKVKIQQTVISLALAYMSHIQVIQAATISNTEANYIRYVKRVIPFFF